MSPRTVAVAPGRALRASRARAHRSRASRRRGASSARPPTPLSSFVLGRHGALGPRGRSLAARMRAAPGGREGGQRPRWTLPNRSPSLQQ